MNGYNDAAELAEIVGIDRGGILPKIYPAIISYIGHSELASIASPSRLWATVCGRVALWVADTRRLRQVLVAFRLL